jgi:hypothetical protein
MTDEATNQAKKLKTMRARLAAHESWAITTDRTGRTAPARAALEQRFLDQAGGDAVKVANVRTAYYLRLAMKSAEARRKARAGQEAT